MLIEFLRLIAMGQVRSLGEAAQRLNISETLAAQMAEQLARQGYLAAPATCGGGCAGCAQAAACGLKPAVRLWTLTNKGRGIL